MLILSFYTEALWDEVCQLQLDQGFLMKLFLLSETVGIGRTKLFMEQYQAQTSCHKKKKNRITI